MEVGASVRLAEGLLWRMSISGRGRLRVRVGRKHVVIINRFLCCYLFLSLAFTTVLAFAAQNAWDWYLIMV